MRQCLLTLKKIPIGWTLCHLSYFAVIVVFVWHGFSLSDLMILFYKKSRSACIFGLAHLSWASVVKTQTPWVLFWSSSHSFTHLSHLFYIGYFKWWTLKATKNTRHQSVLNWCKEQYCSLFWLIAPFTLIFKTNGHSCHLPIHNDIIGVPEYYY